MEQITNKPAPAPTAATNEPAVPSNPIDPTDPIRALIDSAVHAGADPLTGRPAREDGWTPDRIRLFLRTLAATGCVRESARAAGITKQAAYVLRASTKGRAFALAWRAAVRASRGRLAEDLLSRALHGHVETVYREGQVFEQRHRFDHGLAMRLLDRLDRLADDKGRGDNADRFVEEEFDQYLEIAAAGGEGAAAFVASRCSLGFSGHDEARVLERAENFAATGEGLPEGYETGESAIAASIRALFAAAGAPDEEDDEYEDDEYEDDEYEDEEHEDDDDDGEAGEAGSGAAGQGVTDPRRCGEKAAFASRTDVAHADADPVLRAAPPDASRRPDTGTRPAGVDPGGDGLRAGNPEHAGRNDSQSSSR